MMNNWKEINLGKIYKLEGGKIQTGPFGSQLHESDYKEVGIPVIMPKDIVDDKLNLSTVARISEEDANRLSQHLVIENDIIFPRRGEINKRVLITEKTSGAFCGTGCIRLRGNGSVLNPLFLFYYVKQQAVVTWIENQAVGSTMMNLNTSIIKNIPITLPPLPVQQKIASILSAYDDLIENNNQRIKLLEEMAEEIYKEWFVRLRFPGYQECKYFDKDGTQVERESEGALPEGWEEVRLSSLYNTSSGGTPSRKIKEYYDEGSYNWIKTGELNEGFIFDTSEKITAKAIDNSSAKLFPIGTVLLAMYGATIGKLGILAEPSTTNQASCAIISKNDIFQYNYIFSYFKYSIAEIINLGMGAAQQNISQEVIKGLYIKKSTTELMNKFNDLSLPLFELKKNLQQKNQLLQETHDLLLPRLISGKLSMEGLIAQRL